MVSIGLVGINEYPKNLLVLFWSIFAIGKSTMGPAAKWAV